jgi:hypothetical protein
MSNKQMSCFGGCVVGGCLVMSTHAALAQVVPATLILKEGDALLGSTVSSLGEPFTNSLGHVGFTYSTANSDRGIFINNASVFDDSSNAALSGSEATMGISNAGGFLYSPSVSTEDAVWSNFGLLHVAGEPAPQSPVQFVSFASRPRMTANGTAAWVGGRANTLGGASVQRVFHLNRDPSSPANTITAFAGGDVLGGVAITAAGVGFTYDISDDGTEYLNVVVFTGAAATDAGVVKNASQIVMREGSPADGVGNWQTIGPVGINDSGDYLILGDTDAAAASDGFVSVNGLIKIREGELIAGSPLSSTFNAASISNQGRIAFIANLGTVESLVAGHASNLSASTSTRLLAVGQQIDTNGDLAADFVVSNFLASNTIAPGLDLADDGRVFARVDLTPVGGGTAVQAIIGLAMPSLCDSIDFNGDGLFPDDQDLIDFLSVLAGGACSTGTCNDIDFNNDGLFPDDNDLVAFLTVLAGGNC